MVFRESANDYLSSKDVGKTQKELIWLENIIKKDNINFETQDNYKHLDNAKIFDDAAENLFDMFMNTNRKEIKYDVLSKNISWKEKMALLQKKFHNFVEKALKEENTETSQENIYIRNAINLFRTALNNLNEELQEQKTIVFNLSSLELQVLEDDILNPEKNHQSTWNLAWYWYFHGLDLDETEQYENNTKKKQKNSSKNKKEGEKEEKITNTESASFIEQLSFSLRDNYYDTYDKSPNFWYINQEKKISWSEHTVENIYDDRHIKRVLENIFDPNEQQQLEKNTFGVNLDADHGLAYVVSKIEEIINKDISLIIPQDQDDRERFMLLLPTLTPVQILKEIETKKTDNGWIFAGGWLTDVELKKYFSDNEIDYRKERGMKWRDNENGKIAKILNRAKWTDLLDFSEIMKARKNPDNVLKQWFNAKETSKSVTLDENNILWFLADINGDAVISADKSRKNKEQFKYGDLGNLSGEQIFFTMNQAIQEQDALKWNGEGEKTVIKNIARMITVMAKEMEERPDAMVQLEFWKTVDLFSSAYKHALKNVSENPNKENLLALIKNYPQSKVFFLAALEKIGGGSSLNQVDLYDILTGQEGKRLQQIDTTNEIESLRKTIDLQLQDPKFEKIIQQYGKIEVRESIMQKIMEVVNGINISVVLDPATEQDMIMSGISKTFYEEQARKTILGDINIQNISFGASINEIKLWYQIGKSYISSDGRSKYHVMGGPSLYLTKNWVFSGGIDINFAVAEQVNFAKVTSASLSDVQQAKYLGLEWWAGAKINKNGGGLYALLGVSTEKDALMGISQLETIYQQVSNRIFDLDGMTTFTSETIKNKLLSHLGTIKNDTYSPFIKNNTNKITNDINQTMNYLTWLGIIDEINNSTISDQEKQQALSSLLRIIQQGNIDQRKSDIIMNLHNDLKFTKFSAGLSAGTWFFGAKSDTYKGNGTPGDGSDIDWGNDDTITPESWNTAQWSSWWDTRLSFLGLYVGARLSTWKNTYLPNTKQLLFTEQEMNKWIVDHIEAGKDLETYAKFLTGRFNKEWLSVSVFKKNGKEYLEIKFTPTTQPAPSLDELLNIHYDINKAHEFAFVKKDNRLIIGNVGDITAYTTTLPGGVDRVLCLGSKSLNGKNIVRLKNDNNVSTLPHGIEFKENGVEFFNKQKLDGTIDALKKDTQAINDPDMISLYKSLFDTEGKLILAPENVTYTSAVAIGQQFATGTITLYKQSDNTYVLDYQPSTDNKLHIEYKTTGTTRSEIKNISNPDLSESFTTIQFPSLKDAADIEHSYKTDFNTFIKNITSGNFDDAERSLLNIIGTTSSIGKQLQNGSPEERQYIIDNYVSIFAYETHYQGKSLKELFEGKIKDGKIITPWRWDLFLKYQWPGKKNFSESLKTDILWLREALIDKYSTTKYEAFTRETPKNIFWYTAFYRSGVTDRWYGATPFGKTNIIQGSLSEIWKDKSTEEKLIVQQEGKQRIVDNLAKDERHTKLLIQQIKKSINNSNISQHLDEKNLGKLILDGYLDIPNNNNGNPIDISSKKLILNSKPIFYLLGECINESIWLRIDDIRIQENIDTYAAEDTPDKKYISPFYGKNNSIAGDIHSEMNNVWLTGYKKIGNTSKNEKKDYNEGNPWEGDDPDTNNDEIINWE